MALPSVRKLHAELLQKKQFALAYSAITDSTTANVGYKPRRYSEAYGCYRKMDVASQPVYDVFSKVAERRESKSVAVLSQRTPRAKGRSETENQPLTELAKTRSKTFKNRKQSPEEDQVCEVTRPRELGLELVNHELVSPLRLCVLSERQRSALLGERVRDRSFDRIRSQFIRTIPSQSSRRH